MKLRFGIVELAALLRLRAGMFEKLGVVHSRRTSGHASETSEAKIHFVGECLRGSSRSSAIARINAIRPRGLLRSSFVAS